MVGDIEFRALPVTRKLFHEDPYQRAASATVVAVSEMDIVLDETIFYAESGGQAPDRGTIGGVRVVDVQKEAGHWVQLPNGETAKVDSVIRHRLAEEAPFAVGDEVALELDWARRFHNMQMHTLAHFLFIATGEHLASVGVPLATKGCYIETDSARFDFVGRIEAEAVPGIEARVRELVETSGTASVEKLQDDVFMWRSAGREIPCGGTHVADAGEIVGAVDVRRRSKGSSLTRLYVTLGR